MQMIGKRHSGWLLAGILLLAVPAAQAKRPDADDGPRYERGQTESRAERRASRREPSGAMERYDSRRGRDDTRDRYERGGQRPASPGIGLSQAVAEAERRTGGRVLSAEPRDDGGRVYYRVKVLAPDGRVQILTIDAR